MGRGKKRQRNNGEGKGGKRARSDQESYQNLVLESKKFEDYYKGQNLIDPKDWDTFMSALRTPLPTTFRITEGAYASEIKRRLEHDFLSQEKCDQMEPEDGVTVEAPKPLPWYPGNNGWYFKATKKQLRRWSALQEFHKFLVSQTENGNISRQEAVSMIPPFFLDVQSHHRVLDMCAAPGSKTAQILEAIHANCGGKMPTGVVVANELSRERCYMLVHQIKRLTSPCVLVCNHEAQNFPFIKVPATEEELRSSTLEGSTKDGKITFQFDRILADVPCSGDGAMRKIPEMWQKWSAALGIGMHRLQVKIAFRGAKLLKVGGRMVYSTCSLNPMEDEAVVAELLRQCKGALRLVDVSSQLPDLKRFPGVSSWKVQDKSGNWYPSHEDIKEPILRNKISPTVFPPTEEEAKTMELHKCLRFFPHINDTGGFFVAVLEKVSPMPWPNQEQQKSGMETQGKEEEGAPKTEGNQEEKMQEEKTQEEKGEGGKAEVDKAQEAEVEVGIEDERPAKKRTPEEPFMPLTKEMLDRLQDVNQAFGIGEKFPFNQLMARSEKSPKIYFMSPTIAELLANDSRKLLQVINTGVKLFVKHTMKDLATTFRLSQEGVHWLFPFVTKRVVTISEKEFFILLDKKDPFTLEFTVPTRDALDALDQGPLVFVLDQNCTNEGWSGMVAAGWKGRVSCKLLLSKEEIMAIRQLGRRPEKSN